MKTPSLKDFRRIVVKVALVTAGRCRRRLAQTRVARLARSRCRRAPQGDERHHREVSSGADRAPAAPMLKLPGWRAQARGQSGRRRRRADRAGARAGRKASSAHGLTAGQVLVTLGDTEERRSLSQRALDYRQAFGMAQRTGDQRERHRRHFRDPLRRQRPARRPRHRHHDERRLAGAAVGRRRALRQAAGRRRRDALVPVVARITPEEIEAMAGASGSEPSRGGMLTKIEAGQDRHERRHAYDHRVRPCRASS